MHYTAWIARRWHDPAFPRRVPMFASRVTGRARAGAARGSVRRLDQPPLACSSERYVTRRAVLAVKNLGAGR